MDEAAKRGRWIAGLPHGSPDLFNGTAGRVLFHLLLWDEFGEREHLSAARDAGEILLRAAESTEHDGLLWTIPPGYEGLSGQANLGYAHGAAGIGDALLDLAEASGDERFLKAARAAGRWLASLAIPVLEDGNGVGWPINAGEPVTSAFWCHGAAGISRFFLHLSRLDGLQGAEDLAQRGGLASARTVRWASPTQCHGLAGNIELLLDLYQASGNDAYLIEARSMGRLLDAFRTERDGHLVWPSETPAVITPDYMVGYAGVAVCMLRLAAPERRPHGVSRAGFRYQGPAINAGRPEAKR